MKNVQEHGFDWGEQNGIEWTDWVNMEHGAFPGYLRQFKVGQRAELAD